MSFLITIILCYILIALIKQTKIANEWLPLISGALGIGLNVAAFYLVPTLIPCEEIAMAIFYGFMCGLAATGSNQLLKQACKYILNKYSIDLPQPNSNEIDKED